MLVLEHTYSFQTIKFETAAFLQAQRQESIRPEGSGFKGGWLQRGFKGVEGFQGMNPAFLTSKNVFVWLFSSCGVVSTFLFISLRLEKTWRLLKKTGGGASKLDPACFVFMVFAVDALPTELSRLWL